MGNIFAKLFGPQFILDAMQVGFMLIDLHQYGPNWFPIMYSPPFLLGFPCKWDARWTTIWMTSGPCYGVQR